MLMFLLIRTILFIAVVLPSGCDLHKQSKKSKEPTLEQPVLAVVTGDHCAACVRQKPVVDKIRKLKNLHIFEVNLSKDPKYKKLWNIRALPTYIYWDKDPKKPAWKTSSAKEALERLTKPEE